MEIQREKQNQNNRKDMNIERDIVSYDKKTEHLVAIFPISIGIDIIRQLFLPYENDPLFYNPYEIDKEKLKLLKKHIDIDIDFNFEVFDYYLEAFSI